MQERMDLFEPLFATWETQYNQLNNSFHEFESSVRRKETTGSPTMTKLLHEHDKLEKQIAVLNTKIETTVKTMGDTMNIKLAEMESTFDGRLKHITGSAVKKSKVATTDGSTMDQSLVDDLLVQIQNINERLDNHIKNNSEMMSVHEARRIQEFNVVKNLTDDVAFWKHQSCTRDELNVQMNRMSADWMTRIDQYLLQARETLAVPEISTNERFTPAKREELVNLTRDICMKEMKEYVSASMSRQNAKDTSSNIYEKDL